MATNIEALFDPRSSNLTYVVWDPETLDAVVIDPVLDYDPKTSRTWTESLDAVSTFVREHGLTVHYSLETHAHADHLSGGQILRRRFDAKVAIGAGIDLVQQTFKGVFDYGSDFPTDGSQFDVLVEEGTPIEAGSLHIEVIATPGHTPACMTYQVGDALFTGDALFIEDYGTGRCDFPKGSASNLYDSVQKLYAFPDEMRVFPGHDYQPGGRELRWETTIGAEKSGNTQIKGGTSREDFVRFRTERDATLSAPQLLLPSVQVNINAGRLPAPRDNGMRYLNIPLNAFHPADELGEPLEE